MEPVKSEQRQKPIAEHMREAVNNQTVAIAERGMKAIDDLKARGLKKARESGIEGLDDLAEAGANYLKSWLLRGLSK